MRTAGLAATVGLVVSLAVVAACGNRGATVDGQRPDGRAADARGPDARPAAAALPARPTRPLEPGDRLPPHRRYPDAATALLDLTPPGMRVIGVGELHVRVDRTQARSALAVFTTEIMPAIAERVSDLVLETWIVDPRCKAKGAAASARIEQAMKRPASTQNELAGQIGRAQGAGVKVHALRMTCADYDVVAPEEGGIQAEALLSLVTRELGRIAKSAVAFRDAKATGSGSGGATPARPWVAVYGGALHNDLAPMKALAEWSYAGDVDAVTGGRFMEVDLIVPEFAEQDPASQPLPWFPLVHETPPGTGVVAWQRNDHSIVIVLPRGAT